MHNTDDDYLDDGVKTIKRTPKNGKAPTHSIPMRRCLASGNSQPQSGMIRFVVSPDNVVTPDIKGNLPGRGMWVSANGDALQTVITKRLFNRGAKKQVTVPDNLMQMIVDIYQKRCLSNLSLANRAGNVIMGRDNVKTALQNNVGVACLVQGCDASVNELDKLAVIAKATDTPVMRPLTAAQMGQAFGKDHAVHAVITQGGLATLLMTDMENLSKIL